MNRTIVKTDGNTIDYAPKAGAHYELEELNQIVGGYIQIVNLHDGRLMIMNEEGKLMGLEFNQTATDIAHDAGALFDDDFIVGDVLVCNEEDIL